MNGHSRSEVPHGLETAGVTLREWQQFITDIDACGFAINPYLVYCLSIPPFWVCGCLYCCLTDCLEQRKKKLYAVCDKYRALWSSSYGLSVHLNGSNNEVVQNRDQSIPLPKPPGCPKHYFGIQILNQKIIEEFRVLANSDEDEGE